MKRYLLGLVLLLGLLPACTSAEAAHIVLENDPVIIGTDNLGEFASDPASPSVGNSYYNTTDHNSYIYNGTAWNILAPAGATGPQGPAGENGAPGADGAPGPNEITTSTATDFANGVIFKSDGDSVVAATLGADYINAGNLTGYLTTANISDSPANNDTGNATSANWSYDHDNGFDHHKRVVEIKLIDDATAIAANAGNATFCIPSELNGYDLVEAAAYVTTQSTSGTPTYMVINVTDSVNMLSVAITIDANESTSYTAATGPTIDTGEDDVATGDLIKINKTVAGTGEKGDGVILTFRLP